MTAPAEGPATVTLTNGELAEYGQPNEHEPTELLFDRRDVEAIVAARVDALTADLARVPRCSWHHGQYPETCWWCGLNRIESES